ncbi:MAG: hypothetical protein ACREXW_14840 [Gammaproteobacteria bacterium]
MTQRTLSKLDAVRAQLDAAIEIWFTSDNPVAVHTLTAAAYNILRDIALKNGSERPFIKTAFVDEYPEAKRKAIRDFLNNHENFFKHADRDPDSSITLNPELTELLLMDALAYFRDKNEPKPQYYDAFKAWHGVPREGLSDGETIVTEAIRELLKSKGKQDFWAFIKSHLTTGSRRTPQSGAA